MRRPRDAVAAIRRPVLRDPAAVGETRAPGLPPKKSVYIFVCFRDHGHDIDEGEFSYSTSGTIRRAIKEARAREEAVPRMSSAPARTRSPPPVISRPGSRVRACSGRHAQRSRYVGRGSAGGTLCDRGRGADVGIDRAWPPGCACKWPIVRPTRLPGPAIQDDRTRRPGFAKAPRSSAPADWPTTHPSGLTVAIRCVFWPSSTDPYTDHSASKEIHSYSPFRIGISSGNHAAAIASSRRERAPLR